MAISAAQAAGGTCVGAGSNNFANGATALNFTGLTIPATGNCTVTLLVPRSSVGANPNSTSGVTTTQVGAGAGSNTATLTVTPSTPVTLQAFDVESVDLLSSLASLCATWRFDGIEPLLRIPLADITQTDDGGQQFLPRRRLLGLPVVDRLLTHAEQ